MRTDASLDDIAAFLDALLDAPKYASAEPDANGLLFRARERVSKFAVAVNTSFATIAGAAAWGGQLLVVHHTSWAEIDLHLRDAKFAALRDAGVSLYGAHASLDCAGRGLGNSWVLAEQLSIEVDQTFGAYHGGDAGVIGRRAGSLADLIDAASKALGVQVEAHEHARDFGRVGIVPGAGGDTHWLDEARRLGADTYLTGEGSMYTRMFARETGMNLIFGTHHATETPGIRALGERIAAETSLPFEFIPDSADVF